MKTSLKVLYKRKIKTRTKGQLSCQNEEPDNSSKNWGLEVQRLKTTKSYHMFPSNHKIKLVGIETKGVQQFEEVKTRPQVPSNIVGKKRRKTS